MKLHDFLFVFTEIEVFNYNLEKNLKRRGTYTPFMYNHRCMLNCMFVLEICRKVKFIKHPSTYYKKSYPSLTTHPMKDTDERH